MSKVRIKLVDYSIRQNHMGWLGIDDAGKIAMARRLLAGAGYMIQTSIELDKAGEDAAEEVFDLTNNPCREDERQHVYGSGRSVSVGDVVEVDGDNYLCASMGWIKL